MKAITRRLQAGRLNAFREKHPPPGVTIYPPSRGHQRWRAFIDEGIVPGDPRTMVITDYQLGPFVGRLESLFTRARPGAAPR